MAAHDLGGFPPLDSHERRKRKREWIAVVALFVLFVVLTITELRLTNLSRELPFVNSIFFFGLLNVNVIILVAIVWLVFRNIGKLFIERRRKILGARLKTKLVAAFLGFSIIPTLILFAISALYINSSFDKWFSIKVQNTMQASLEITRTYYRDAEQRAMHFAEHLSDGLARRYRPGPGWPDGLGEHLAEQRELLALDAVELYLDPLDERVLARREREGSRQLPSGYPRLSLDLLDRAFGGEQVVTLLHLGSGDLIRCLVPVKAAGAIQGVVAVSAYIPVSLVNKVDEIASVLDDYKDTNPLKSSMKTAYLVILIMITLVIIFVVIWVGLYMARELTVPVERLVYGAQAVGGGNLDVTISGSGHDEIAVLVESFNKMTRDLRENRSRLTDATRALEQRRAQLEAVLANVGTGVLVVERSGAILTFNRALSRLLGVVPDESAGKGYGETLAASAPALAQAIDRVLEGPAGQGREGPENTHFTCTVDGEIRTLACVATPLADAGESQPWGVVAVVDDMTLIVKGQREMAWREVARRIAHEIKNPLTPIKLSAQRLQRRLAGLRGKDGDLIRECTETIIKHTDELKEMVNEFSSFARFPEVTPTRADLNDAVAEVVSLYEQGHPEVRFTLERDPRLPPFELDRDQMKRVLINLLDNAVGALATLPAGREKSVKVETHYHAQLQMAVVIVKDTGPGMSDDIKNRVFEPYFSTKAQGTGLGLAIAKRIVNDHDGFIRVQSAPGEGTQFLIELPTTLKQPMAARPRKVL